MKNLFEYSDILHSPIEAFTCATENFHLPVEAHGTILWRSFICREGSVLVTCNDACKRGGGRKRHVLPAPGCACHLRRRRKKVPLFLYQVQHEPGFG